MSFLVVAALAVAALVALPIAAHLLRRGRATEQEFPPAALVPVAPPVARQRSRLEDRVLFSLRAVMIALLALLGATPFVRCERLSLSRTAGASVAVAIVVDDSMSMRAVTADGDPRWDVALAGARDLLGSARPGDAAAIVLAGRPARLALAATTDVGAARKVLDELEPSDRPTDLAGAVQLARSALEQLPHVDKRVVLLSDLAGEPIRDGTPEVWAPLEAIRQPMDDCGIVEAVRRGKRITVDVACSSASASREREVQVHAGKDSTVEADGAAAGGSGARQGTIASAPLKNRSGVQTIALELDSALTKLEVKLTGDDALAHDDVAPVARHAAALSIAVVTDPTTGSVKTGGATVIEQALASLGGEAGVRPLTVVPDEQADLDAHAALILDDPPGLAADARIAVREWLERGGVALALIGPGTMRTQLGSTLEPFADGAVRWEKTEEPGIDPASMSWLGDEARSLKDVAPRGRARLDGAHPQGARVAGRWKDGSAWMLESAVGRGLALTIGLPSSVDQSDFALRPAFLALLDYVVSQAERRSGPRRTVAGAVWLFPGAKNVAARGPEGPLTVLDASSAAARCEGIADAGGAADECADRATTLQQKSAVAAVRGAYVVDVDGDRQTRIVTIDPDEIRRSPQTLDAAVATSGGGGTKALVDVSPQIALALLVLFAGELILRGLRRAPRRGERRRSAA